MPQTIRLDVADAIARITLDRPERLNAFGDDMREQLLATLERVAATAGVRVLVITGAGRAFCAGGDVHHMVALKERAAGIEAIEPFLDAGRAIVTRIAALPFPTLAAVNGPAAGAGLNLALACDLRLASERATFGATFVKIGLHPDWGGTWFLPRLVGTAKALELCWTGDSIDAAEALRIGLVNRVVAHDAFESDVAAFAARLAAAPETAVRLAKQSLRAAAALTLAQSIDAETQAQHVCWGSPDTAEGLRAFVEKRAARFGATAPGASAPLEADAVAASPQFE